MKDTLMVICTSINRWKALVTAFSFCCYHISLHGLVASYMRQKDCGISEMCHGTSMIELRIEKIPSVSLLFFVNLWQGTKHLAGSSWQAAENLPPGFLTIQP
jgi:hypothetical protein